MSSKLGTKFLFIFIWPFPAFISVFKDLKTKYLLLFFMLFAAFVGINMYNSYTSDFYQYVVYSTYYKDTSLKDIFLEKDFFYPLLSKLVNLISSDFYFITVCFTSVYYFLFYKSIKVISDNINPDYNAYIPFFYVLALYSVLPFTAVTAFRYNSAVLFFSWCLLEYSINNKKKFLYIILLTPIIHFSFIFYILLPFIYLAIKNLKHRNNIVLLFFVFSYVYSNSNIPLVIDNFSKNYLSESVSNQVDAYASEEGVETNEARYSTAVKKGSTKRAINRGIIEYSRQVLMFSLVFFVLKRRRFLINNKFYENLVLLALLSYSLTNLASSVYHGNRFFSVSNFYFYFVLFYMIASSKMSFEQNRAFYRNNKPLFHFISFIIIINFFNIVYMSRSAFNFTNMIFGNWITSFLF